MTYRIGMWIVIALMVAQASLYHLVIMPKYSRLYARYSLALAGAVSAMTDCSNLLDRMDVALTDMREYVNDCTYDE